MKQIKYKSGYKYQIVGNFYVQTDIYPEENILTQYIHLSKMGILLIKNGYASDGPSGITIDTKTFMRGAFAHDALYQLLREKHLPHSAKDKADKLLQKLCIEDGMCKARAWYVYQAVKHFAGYAANPKNKKKILTAP